ncbi:MAG: fused MFS/spermidine synthase [Candidatus Sumerlaeia bacterium]|nr:fused MFS/spermidine synthase [Candidatus Sumerlaeia bacterium]
MAKTRPAPAEIAPPASPPPLWLLMVTVIMTGSAVIMIEVLGSRIVGPFFGVSLYIWTALISVALIALSAGYFLGGIVADRFPRATGLYGLIGAAAVTTLLIPLYDREVCFWAAHPDRFGIKAGVLIASIILFLPPLTLLGFVAPYALRLALQDLQHAGRIAGLLYAVSTVGSVLGSVLAGFYLVPLFGVTVTLVIIAAVLVIPCGLWAIVARRPGRGAAIVLAAGALAVLGVWRTEARPYANQSNVHLLSEQDGLYAQVSVADTRIQDSWVRWILIDGIPQTGVIAPRPENPEARWYENWTPLHDIQFHFYRLHQRQPRSALVIGLGGGAVPMALARQGVEVEVVDIDPLIVEASTQYMGFNPAVVPVHIADGRAHIRNCRRTYDLVIFDVATGGAQPFHLFSQEIFQETARILNPGGVVAINYIGFPPGEHDFLCRAVFTTVTSVFPESVTYIFPPRPDQETLCNIMFFFSETAFPDDRALRDDPSTPAEDRRLLERQFLNLRRTIEPNGAILTDNWNPIEAHSVRVNEVWRRQVFENFQAELHRL